MFVHKRKILCQQKDKYSRPKKSTEVQEQSTNTSSALMICDKTDLNRYLMQQTMTTMTMKMPKSVLEMRKAK